MKRNLTIPLLACSLLSTPAFAESPQELKQESKAAIQALAKGLMKELKGAMKQGGPVAAIETCNTKALPITRKISEEQGWSISRTSEKLRNHANKPNSWEQKVLAQFQQQADAGADLKTLAYSEIIEVDGQKEFRMMKAIPVAEACLACHGSNLKPGIAGKLKSLYPEDQATGFSQGELRGAFTLSKKL